MKTKKSVSDAEDARMKVENCLSLDRERRERERERERERDENSLWLMLFLCLLREEKKDLNYPRKLEKEFGQISWSG